MAELQEMGQMRLTISVRNLREIADLLNTVVTEAKLKIDQSGITVKAVDPAHVAMISLEIPKGAFSEYQVESEEEIAIDVERLKSVIKLASSNDSVTMSKDKEKLKFEIGTIAKSIALLDSQAVTTPRVPQISSDYYVVLNKSELERGLKAAEDISDAVRFTLTPDEFRARSVSDSEESELRLPKDMLKEIKCNVTIKSSYPLEYLLKFVKSLASADVIKLSFKDDYPLSIDFNFGYGKDGTQGAIKGTFLLAPRMEQ
ncbi:DNA polymerase III sliding clamp [Thermogymnomonas acidicola]|uniref:DNA polymerase sliding clamp n=1 Tax=Thermogymnomonas acidicola TaxID=399579 RepID=A0AA37BPM2_9ARCH|nr:DNA polymerase sliding clamp [Thermogymnomonas acidicola]GGM65797.1 DNA polymerase III sliding clamp [Thermogymnomonas acidicola]